MRRSITSFLLTGALAALPVALIGTTSSADIGYAQQVKLKDEAPESGRYVMGYKNYSEKMKLCMEDGYCQFLGYRKSEGQVEVKLSTYRISEGRKRFDYYILDVDILNNDREGTSDNGWFKSVVRHSAARVVDQANTKSAYFDDDKDCEAVQVGLSTPWPIVSAAVDLGTVTFCEKGARYSMSTSGTASVYFADNAREIKHVASERILKVRRGDKPKFSVTVTVPTDDCTEEGTGSADGNCVDFDNETTTRTFSVGTSG